MKAKKCPICGETSLHDKRGEYRMDLPPNLAQESVLIPDATWLHCDSCGEDVLSPELEATINRQRERKASPAA